MSRLKVFLQEVIDLVMSAQAAALDGQSSHLLSPGLNWPVWHEIRGTQLLPL